MSKLETIVEGKQFKNFMSKLYGFGAAIVIVGALFKIMHWPGAGIMLTVGLSTEAIIFMFSAFQPVHEDPDWGLVYPELAGHDEDIDLLDVDEEDEEKAAQLEKPITEQLDDLLEDAKIGPELLESLQVGLTSLSTSASKMSDISNANLATEEYVQNVKGASSSISELGNAYSKTTEALSADLDVSSEFVDKVKSASSSVDNLSASYNAAAESLNNDLNSTKEYSESVQNAISNAKTLADTYKESADKLAKSAEILDFAKMDSTAYQQQMETIANSLSSLNSVYELQLQNATTQNDATSALNATVDKLRDNLDTTVEDTLKFKEEIARMNEHLSSLNNVYGNMLTAMSVK